MNPEQFPIIDQFYHFHCTLCGNCCTGSQQVHLTPYDLYKMAQFLKYKSSLFLFSKNLVILIKTKQGVWLPRIRFKRKPFRFCPFLINEAEQGICQLHPRHKPLICSMAPVGRVIDFERQGESWHLVPPVDDCRGMESPVENKLSDFQRVHENELGWQKRFFALLNQLQNKNWQKEKFKTDLYALDLNRPFSEQFEEMERSLMQSF